MSLCVGPLQYEDTAVLTNGEWYRTRILLFYGRGTLQYGYTYVPLSLLRGGVDTGQVSWGVIQVVPGSTGIPPLTLSGTGWYRLCALLSGHRSYLVMGSTLLLLLQLPGLLGTGGLSHGFWHE